MIIIGARPESGFDQPLGMLEDCHRRILRFVRVLERVAREERDLSLSERARNEVREALGYFAVAGQRHHADEEKSLFPRLRKHEPALEETVVRLEMEHVRADALQDEIDARFRCWLADGNTDDTTPKRLMALTRELVEFYERHIVEEESSIFPRARQLLTPEQMQAVGAEMAARRRES